MKETHAVGAVGPAAKVFHFGDQLIAEPRGHNGEPEHIGARLLTTPRRSAQQMELNYNSAIDN